MAQIYERKDIYDDLAKNIGTGLQNLANYKLQQMHKTKEEEENYNFLKTIYPEHVAKALAPQSEKTRNEFLKNFEANPAYQQQGQQPSEQAQVAGGFKPDIPEDQLKSFVDYLNSPDSPDDFSELMKSQEGQQKPPMPGAENLIPQLKQQQPGNIPTQAPKSMAPMQPQATMQQAAPMAQPSAPTENVPSVVEEQVNVSPVRRRGSAVADKAERLANKKDVDKYLAKLNVEVDTANFAEPRLREMKKIIKEGGLPTAATYKIFKQLEDINPLVGSGAGTVIGGALGGLGGAAAGPVGAVAGTAAGARTGGVIGAALGAAVSPIATLLHNADKWLVNPNEEKFEKLSASFLRGAKDTFGGRFTNEEMKAYLAMIPTLSQTDRGKLDVIEDMEIFNKAAKIKRNNAVKVLRENPNLTADELRDQVELRSAKELNKLADRFREDFI